MQLAPASTEAPVTTGLWLVNERAIGQYAGLKVAMIPSRTRGNRLAVVVCADQPHAGARLTASRNYLTTTNPHLKVA